MPDLYQSIVFRKPSSKPVLALKPNSRSAFEVSRHLLGWPSGFVASHIISPSKPVSFAIRCTRSFIDISKPAPRLTGSAFSYLSAARTIPSAASSTNKNSLVALPVPQTVIEGSPEGIVLAAEKKPGRSYLRGRRDSPAAERPN